MHYAEFAEDEVCTSQVMEPSPVCVLVYSPACQQSQALMNAIKEYENNKWKVIGQKVGKPAKVRSR